MSGAALALALALLVAPATPARRLPARVPTDVRQRRRISLLAGVPVLLVALAVVLPITAVIAVAIVAGTLAVRHRRRRIQARRSDECLALQGGLDVLVGELRAGAHPVSAFETAADEVQGAVAGSLRAVAARARLGADVAGGLHTAARASALPRHWERLAVYWGLAQAQGLAIAPLMDTAQRDILARERFSSKVNAAMAGARTTAALLAGLPLLGIALGQSIGADPVAFLLSGGAGGWLLVVGVTLACCGLLWSDRITRGVLT